MKKILVVDDSPAWRMFHKNNLEEVFTELDIADYKIDYGTSGREGYDFVMQNHDNPYDLIISDLQMEEDFAPKFAGEWFIEQVKTFNKYFNTKIIICSGCYNIKLPLIIDDAFVNFDQERTTAVLKCLNNFAEENQVLYFTCHAKMIKSILESEKIPHNLIEL